MYEQYCHNCMCVQCHSNFMQVMIHFSNSKNGGTEMIITSTHSTEITLAIMWHHILAQCILYTIMVVNFTCCQVQVASVIKRYCHFRGLSAVCACLQAIVTTLVSVISIYSFYMLTWICMQECGQASMSFRTLFLMFRRIPETTTLQFF